MVEKHGTYPANARVDVDYSKGKPKIKFTYPKTGRTPEKDAIKQFRAGPIGIIILLLAAIPFAIFTFDDMKIVDFPEECNVTLDKHYINISLYTESDGENVTNNNYKTWVEGANFTCTNKTYMVEFNKHVDKRNGIYAGFYFKSDKSIWNRLNDIFFPFYIGGMSLFLLYLLSKKLAKYLVNKRWYQKWLPKYQADGLFKMKKKKYTKFKINDVENNIVEVPHFKNVELDYKTSGDFSDKLEKIKIREYQYHDYKNGKIGKKQVKIGDWYARFYFKEKPKNGYLEVIFQ